MRLYVLTLIGILVMFSIVARDIVRLEHRVTYLEGQLKLEQKWRRDTSVKWMKATTTSETTYYMCEVVSK